jgi:hypothetical protein
MNLIVYIGKGTGDPEEMSTEAAGTKTVHYMKELLGPWHSCGRKVYTDNYYTSIPAMHELKKLGYFLCGTLRANRKGLCKNALIAKSEYKDLKKSPGYQRFASNGEILQLSWFDKRPVTMLSNFHGGGPRAVLTESTKPPNRKGWSAHMICSKEGSR